MSNEQPTKRRATMVSYQATTDSDGKPVVRKFEAVDYWHVEEIDARTQAALAGGWQHVEISDEPDAGPGGYHGEYVELDGTVRPATTPTKKKG